MDARAFADNKRLETVSLEGNVRLTSLPTRLFHGSPLLARVSVRGSALASLDAAHFPLDRLQTLDVADVPLTCNCSLLWLWLLCKEQRQHVIAVNETATAAAAGTYSDELRGRIGSCLAVVVVVIAHFWFCLQLPRPLRPPRRWRPLRCPRRHPHCLSGVLAGPSRRR